MKLAELRASIPLFAQGNALGSGPFVYLDNAATSQKPMQVIETLDRYYASQNANIHRSPHTLGQRATESYERVRARVKQLFNAHEYEVIFTRGATEALNLVIAGVARARDGAIVTSMIDHHSSFVAAQQHAKHYKRAFRVLDIANGFSSLDRIEGASLVSVPMVSNVTGEILNYADVITAAKAHGSLVLLDACQAAPHLLLDCDAMGADAYAFSAHKMLGPTGLGVLIAKRDLLDAIEPLLYGGEMVDTVSVSATTFAEIPHRFEAGTMPIAQVIAFATAIDILASLDRSELEGHRVIISTKLLAGLDALGLRILSAYEDPFSHTRIPIASFVGDFHPYDAALLLDSRGIATRAGHHCAEPFHRSLGVEGSLRASAYLYSKTDDIDHFLEELEVTIRKTE
jgi:cysteine desulfurase / selenocysteine lyase